MRDIAAISIYLGGVTAIGTLTATKTTTGITTVAAVMDDLTGLCNMYNLDALKAAMTIGTIGTAVDIIMSKYASSATLGVQVALTMMYGVVNPVRLLTTTWFNGITATLTVRLEITPILGPMVNTSSLHPTETAVHVIPTADSASPLTIIVTCARIIHF